jgi:predicted RNase H-like HicB family nuclease
MSEYIALIHKDFGSGIGASFPDLPGCISAADTLEELHPIIEEALGFHIEGMIEDGDAVPEPSSVDEILKTKGCIDAVALLPITGRNLRLQKEFQNSTNQYGGSSTAIGSGSTWPQNRTTARA